MVTSSFEIKMWGSIIFSKILKTHSKSNKSENKKLYKDFHLNFKKQL
jgi:hypothetical protein